MGRRNVSLLKTVNSCRVQLKLSSDETLRWVGCVAAAWRPSGSAAPVADQHRSLLHSSSAQSKTTCGRTVHEQTGRFSICQGFLQKIFQTWSLCCKSHPGAVEVNDLMNPIYWSLICIRSEQPHCLWFSGEANVHYITTILKCIYHEGISESHNFLPCDRVLIS